MRISCSLLAAVLLAAGCGGSAAPPVSDAGSRPPRPVDTLAVQLFTVAQDTVITPLVAAWPDSEPTAGNAGLPDRAEPDAAATLYRIQLFTSKDRAEAAAVRDEAEGDFNTEVRVDFETPYYKVRVGAYATPQEAEPALKRARALGYRGAWAVRVRAPARPE